MRVLMCGPMDGDERPEKREKEKLRKKENKIR